MDARELQQELFGGLHDFHTNRTAVMIEALESKLGSEVLETVKKTGADTYGLYKWHMVRTVSMIEALIKVYGSDVADEINRIQNNVRYEQGKKLGEQSQSNSLEDIIPYFTFGNDENIIEKTDKYVIIKSPKCMIGNIINETSNPNIAYGLHCGTDRYFVEGFNRGLSCEVTQSIAEGHDYCVHKIYITDEKPCGK